MPDTLSGGVRIHWEEEGRGDPLLMIMGLGCCLRMWHALRPIFAKHFRLILFDNRGVGSSASPRGPHWIRNMARDAATVLDAAGVDRAHVLGVSMGGMIAQEFAIRFPSRVRKLVLGCTTSIGFPVHANFRSLWSLVPKISASPEEQLKAMEPFLWHPASPRERVDADLAVLRANFPGRGAFAAQLAGILAWRSWRRLPRIQAETLVIHGSEDRLVPVQNARVLARRIPNSKLVLIPGAGHFFATDQPEPSLRAVLEFLGVSRVSPAPAEATEAESRPTRPDTPDRKS